MFLLLTLSSSPPPLPSMSSSVSSSTQLVLTLSITWGAHAGILPRLSTSRVVRRMLGVGHVREMTSDERTWVEKGEGNRRFWAWTRVGNGILGWEGAGKGAQRSARGTGDVVIMACWLRTQMYDCVR